MVLLFECMAAGVEVGVRVGHLIQTAHDDPNGQGHSGSADQEEEEGGDDTDLHELAEEGTRGERTGQLSPAGLDCASRVERSQKP